jgi:hypothetical protein
MTQGKSNSPASSGSLTDSPWFWLALFSFMGIAAALAIGPKFARRQAGLEEKYEHRLMAQAARQQQLADAEQSPTIDAPAPEAAEDETEAPSEEPYYEPPSRREAPDRLRPLVWVLFAVLFLSAIRVALVGRARRLGS